MKRILIAIFLLGDDTTQLLDFVINTRVATCVCVNCRHQRRYVEEEPREDLGCSLKAVDVDEEGKCNAYEHI